MLYLKSQSVVSPPCEVGASRQQKNIFLGGEGKNDISRCWGMGKYDGNSLAEKINYN